jgi:glutamate synthase (NADPH/NADH) large chain
VVEGLGDHGCEYMTGGVVVVVGRVGRNFAAGMSGGIAYVWDPEGQLGAHCNSAGVDLERVEDPAALHSLIETHWSATGSERARALLDDWRASAADFVQVMPREYRRALAELAA